MRNERRKILTLFLIVIMTLSALTLSSCNRRYDEEEVIAATEILLKDAEMLNIVYYGSGIEYYDSDEEKGYYRKANDNHLESLGFSTIDELKALTEKTFSEEYSSILYSTILSPMTTDTSIVTPARYYQAYDEQTGEPTHLMVYSNFTLMMKDKIEYDYSTLKAVGSKKEKVYVTVEATVTREDGKSQRTTVTITLVEEESGWRIDNPTYANYNEYKDRYDELNNKDLK
ncbi:MAG: hypothetical protein IJW53_02045 [Clostridia bacterium]|nr:hypothetical protein [Clostridia bacterium]